MKIFIFGIGGTGARTLRALSFCLASGAYNVNKDVEFVPMIIDYDAKNGDKKRAVKVMENYKKLHDAAYENHDIEIDNKFRNFFLPRLSYLKDVATADGKKCDDVERTFEFTFNGTTSESKGTFADYLDVKHLSGDKKLTEDLLKVLYNDADREDSDYEFTELNLDMEKGFKGNPNIGTVVFDKISASPEFKTFKNCFVEGDRIFIVGSIFGGTGSSGLPQLIKAIRHKTDEARFSQAPIGASFVMPYFKVNTPEKGGAINSNIFKSKQKAALDYYLKMEEDFNLTASYYVADQDNRQTVLEYSEGDASQKNNAHIVELLSALSILDFAVKKKEDLDGDSLEFGIASDCSVNDPLQLKNFGEGSLRLFLKPMAYLALAGKYDKDYLTTNKRDSKLGYVKKMELTDKLANGFYATYKGFVESYFIWLNEMNQQEHRFCPFETEAKDLDTLVNGFKDGTKRISISDDADYQGFNAICEDQYDKYKGEISKNEYQLFLKMMYETSIMIFNKLKMK